MLWKVSIQDAIVSDPNPGNVVKDYFDADVDFVFMDLGNEMAGLIHIRNRHAQGYFDILNVNLSGISEFIRKTLTRGQYKTYGYKIRQGKRGQELNVVYQYDSNKFLKVAIGTNGYIVSAVPSDNSNYIQSLDY